MEIAEARIKLEIYRKRVNNLRKKIDKLCHFLMEEGEDPDAPKIDLKPRNKEIYKRWKSGESLREIASDLKLSTERIRGICRRIDRVLERQGAAYDEYKDLLPYYNKSK